MFNTHHSAITIRSNLHNICSHFPQRKAIPYIILDDYYQRYVLPSINAIIYVIYTTTSWLFIDLQNEGYMIFISRIFIYYVRTSIEDLHDGPHLLNVFVAHYQK